MEEDLRTIAPILIALRRTMDPQSRSRSLEEIDLQFTKALEEETSGKANMPNGRLAKACQKAQSALLVLRPPRTSQEVLEQVKRAYALADSQLRFMKDVGMISTDLAGRPRLCLGPDVLLKREKAAGYLFAIGFLYGLGIFSLLSDPASGLVLVIRGMGLGLALGSILGFVLTRSFRAYPIVEKIETFAPWTNAGRLSAG